MIETKIKCDRHEYSYSYRSLQEGTILSEAVSEGWYEIDTYNGAITIKKPQTPESFVSAAKHACCALHARKIVEALALQLIPNETEEKSEEAANA
jgi:hypothetical protein